MTPSFSIQPGSPLRMTYSELKRDYKLRITVSNGVATSYTLEKKQQTPGQRILFSLSRMFARDTLEYVEGDLLLNIIAAAKHARPLTGRCSFLATNEDFKRFSKQVHLDPRTQTKLVRGVTKAKIIGKGLEKAARDGKQASKLCATYWHEMLLPQHIYGGDLSAFFNGWKSDASSDLPFEEWLKGYLPPSTSGLGKVAYLSEAERSAYEVKVEAGKLMKGAVPFDTTELSTFHGTGSGIFVIGLDKKIYAGSHITGRFHHSSFLSGGVIFGAGSIKTNALGEIVEITNHSGHYKPSREQILNTLEVLRENGVDLTNVRIIAIQPSGESYSYRSAKAYLDARGEVLQEPVVETISPAVDTSAPAVTDVSAAVVP